MQSARFAMEETLREAKDARPASARQGPYPGLDQGHHTWRSRQLQPCIRCGHRAYRVLKHTTAKPMSATTSTRSPCNRCNKSTHSPQEFLIQCCNCQRFWHHRCHIPPLSEAELIARFEADVDGRPAEGLGSWVCRRCSKKAQTAPVANDASLAISNTGRQSSSTAQLLRDASDSNVVGTVLEVTVDQLQPDTIAMTGYPEQAAPPIERERYEGRSLPVLSDLDTRKNERLQGSRSTLETIATRLLSSPSSTSSRTLSTISQSDTDSRPSSHATSPSLSTSVRSTPPSSTNASSSTPTQAHTPTPQPEIPMRYVDKGKGKEAMPDFRAIIANLRAAGKLSGPPPADYLVDSEVSRQGSSSDYRPSTPRGRMSEELSNIQRDLAGMHVDPQDDDDLYAVAEPSTSSSSREARSRAAPRGWRGQSLAAPREKSLTYLDPGDGRSGSDQGVNEEEILQLYFNLQQRRYDSLEKGQRDKFDEGLARRAHAATTRHQGREEEPRRQRKGPASSLSAKEKLRKNKTVLNLTVGDLLRDKGRLLID